MSGTRKDVSPAGAGADSNLKADFTQAELVNAWAELYNSLPPMLKDGEKSVYMIARELNMDQRKVPELLEKWIAEGRLEHVGTRRTKHGRTVEAYRCKV